MRTTTQCVLKKNETAKLLLNESKGARLGRRCLCSLLNSPASCHAVFHFSHQFVRGEAVNIYLQRLIAIDFSSVRTWLKTSALAEPYLTPQSYMLAVHDSVN